MAHKKYYWAVVYSKGKYELRISRKKHQTARAAEREAKRRHLKDFSVEQYPYPTRHRRRR